MTSRKHKPTLDMVTVTFNDGDFTIDISPDVLMTYDAWDHLHNLCSKNKIAESSMSLANYIQQIAYHILMQEWIQGKVAVQ